MGREVEHCLRITGRWKQNERNAETHLRMSLRLEIDGPSMELIIDGQAD